MAATAPRRAVDTSTGRQKLTQAPTVGEFSIRIQPSCSSMPLWPVLVDGPLAAGLPRVRVAAAPAGLTGRSR